jgi:hypothetical protein
MRSCWLTRNQSVLPERFKRFTLNPQLVNLFTRYPRKAPSNLKDLGSGSTARTPFESAVCGILDVAIDVVLKTRVCHKCNIVKKMSPNIGWEP